MNAAVNAASEAREAKRLAATTAEIARAAISRSGICSAQMRNFSQSGSQCAERRPSPPAGGGRGQGLDSLDKEEWNELGFFASRFNAKTIYTEHVQIMSHMHFNHLAAFNPSLVRIPKKIIKDLRSKYPTARYVASIRHSWGQCQRFETLYKLAAYIVYGKFKSTAEAPGRHSSIVLLDENFCILDIARQVFAEEVDRPNDVGWLAEDVRLLLYDNRILATAVLSSETGKYFLHDFKQRFVVQEVIPEIQSEIFTVRYVAAPAEIYPQLANYTAVTNSRNLGLLVLDGTLQFLTFLGLQAEMQSQLLPLPELPTTLPLLGHFGKWLHNNVNPLVIDHLGMFVTPRDSLQIGSEEPSCVGFLSLGMSTSTNNAKKYLRPQVGIRIFITSCFSITRSPTISSLDLLPSALPSRPMVNATLSNLCPR